MRGFHEGLFVGFAKLPRKLKDALEIVSRFLSRV